MLKIGKDNKVLHGDRLANILGCEVDLVDNTCRVKIKYHNTGKEIWIDSRKLENFNLIKYMKRKYKT